MWPKNVAGLGVVALQLKTLDMKMRSALSMECEFYITYSSSESKVLQDVS